MRPSATFNAALRGLSDPNRLPKTGWRSAVASNDVLSPYPQLVRAGFRRYATYRQAALAGLTTNTVFGLLRASVLVAVLAQRGPVAGYDIATAVTYVWLGQGLLNVVNLWSDRELAGRVRTGDIVIDLGRPWDLQTALLATDFGRAGYAVLMRLLPPVAFGALFFPFRWPERPVTWALFAVAMAARAPRSASASGSCSTSARSGCSTRAACSRCGARSAGCSPG